MLCKNVIGCDERCWIISMSQAFPKQLFIAAKERTWTAKKSTKKNSGAPSLIIKEAGSITTYPGELFRIFWDNVYISFLWIPNEKLSPIVSKLRFKCPEEQFENKVLVVFFSDCLCNCFGWVVKIALRIRRSLGLWFFFQLWSCFRRFCKTRRKKVFIVTKRLSFRNILRRKRIM